MFLWYSGSEPYGENNRLIDGHTERALVAFGPAGGATSRGTAGFSSAAGIWADDSSDQ